MLPQNNISTFSETNESSAAEDKIQKLRKICRDIQHEGTGEVALTAYYFKLIEQDHSLSSKNREALEFIERSIGYRDIILQRLLVFLDLHQINSQLYVIADLFTGIEQIIKPRVPSKISLNIIPAPKLDEYKLSLNKHLLLWVIWEMIDNSIKAIGLKEGNIFISAELWENNIEFLIKDSGKGISSLILNDLFIKEIPSPTTLGLGLYLSNKVIKSFGGKTRVVETAEEGTTISIILPIENLKVD